MPSGNSIFTKLGGAVAERFSGVLATVAEKALPAIPALGRYAQMLQGNIASVPPPPGSRNLLKLYVERPWVHMIVNKISMSAAGVEFYLEDKAGGRVDEHPALDFLKAGSEYLNALQGMAVHYAYMDLVGESFWIIGRDERGNPASWLPIPPTWVQDIAISGADFYEIATPYSEILCIPSSDVIWFKNPNPIDPLQRGTSTTKAANAEIEIDKAAADYLYGFLKNRARPDIVVMGTPQAPLQEADVRRLEQIWLPKFQGMGNSGRPFFSANELTIKEIGASLREHQMEEVRGHQAKILSELYGVPPEIFGRLENSNRATIEGADFLYNSHVVVPRVKLTVSVLDRRLSAEFERKAGLKLAFVSPVREDREIQLKAVVAAPWAFRVNEIRAMGGQPPLPGAEGQERPPMPTQTSTEPGRDPTKPGQAQKPQEPGKKPARAKLKAIRDAADIEAIIEAMDVESADEKALALVIEDAIEIFGDDIAASLDQTYVLEADHAYWAASQAKYVLGLIDETTRSQIREALIDLVETDEATVENAKAAVRAIFALATRTRVKAIADHAANAAGGFASVAMMRKAGTAQKTWHTMEDDKVRHNHEALNGVTIDVEASFQSPDGDSSLFPGGFKSAENNVNCRCFVSTSTKARAAADHVALLKKSAALFIPDITERFERQRELALAAIESSFMGAEE